MPPDSVKGVMNGAATPLNALMISFPVAAFRSSLRIQTIKISYIPLRKMDGFPILSKENNVHDLSLIRFAYLEPFRD